MKSIQKIFAHVTAGIVLADDELKVLQKLALGRGKVHERRNREKNENGKRALLRKCRQDFTTEHKTAVNNRILR